jgi:hypothetical protein
MEQPKVAFKFPVYCEECQDEVVAISEEGTVCDGFLLFLAVCPDCGYGYYLELGYLQFLKGLGVA